MKQDKFLSGVGIAAAASILFPQSAYAENAQVTSVRLQQTSTGIEIILETPDGKPLQGFSAGSDRTFITDIITTQYCVYRMAIPFGKITQHPELHLSPLHHSIPTVFASK